MKLPAGRIEGFLRRPDPAASTVLVYGPNEGLVRERVGRLIRTVLDDPGDPFRASELTVDAVRADPARLADEARSLSLIGGRRVVRLRQATDQVTAACRTLLAVPDPDALVILDAGELGPGSSLRRLIEGAPNATALPCYHDEGRDLSALLERLLTERRLRLEPDAKAYLLDHLGADRAITQSELDKLALYLDPTADGRTPDLRLDEVAALIGDSAALGLDDLVHAAALGEGAQLERCLDRLLGEGEAPVRLVRALANHMSRLYVLAGAVAAEGSVERAIERARPPIHFRRRADVKAELRLWPAPAAAAALGRLLSAEIACKTTGWPAPVVCRRAALALSEQAAAVRRARRAPAPARA